jgi:NAD(P)-dependent dehydrogenase (short-subunit alcohol dehydrogenase family)
MTVIVIGGSGTIGQAIIKELSKRHSIINVGRSKGDLLCDITSEKSIEEMFKKAGKIQSVVIAAGELEFAPLEKMNSGKFQLGINSKLMGQVNVVLIGSKFINAGGSFTLTSGTLNYDPIAGGSSASLVDGALNGFVTAAAIEMPRGIRINAVSPTILEESLDAFGSYFIGWEPVPAAKVALYYSKSVDGHQTGKVYQVLP